MTAAIFNMLLLCTCALLFVNAANTGIATDPVPFNPVPPPPEEISNRDLGEDSKPSEEISSPAHVILPAGDEEVLEHATDNQASNLDTSSPTGPNTQYDIDHFILSWIRTNMNQSRHEDFNEDEALKIIEANCTDISCLHDLDVTSPAAYTPEKDDEDPTAPEEIASSSQSTDRDGILNLEDVSRRQPVDAVVPTNSSNESWDGDKDQNVSPNRGSTSKHRLLNFSTLSQLGIEVPSGIEENDEENNESGDSERIVPEKAIPGNKTEPVLKKSGSEFKFNFVMTKSRLLPEMNDLYESIREITLPDVVQSLKSCGIFPACKLEVTPPREVESFQYLKQTHLYKDKETGVPQFVKEAVDVKCDPTSVSIMTSSTIILAVIIIMSNTIIIIVTLRTKSLRKPHGYFKISLAVADLLNGTFVLTNISSNLVRFIHFNPKDVMQLTQIRREEPNLGEAAFFGVCAVLSQVVTVYSVLLLSVDSFLSVRWPVQYRVGDLITTKRAIGLIAIIWTFALAVSAMPLLAKDYVRYGLSYSTFSYFPVLSPLDKDVSHEDAFMSRYIHVILYAVLVWGIPFLATWSLTILTAYYSRGMLRSMSMARKNAPHFSRNIVRLERDILRTVSIVLAMLTITVLPMMVALVATSLTADNNLLCLEQPIVNLLFAAYYVLVCGSFVNVIVYNACHKEFRRAMFDFLCDVLTWLFSWCCPTFCDLSAARSANPFRNKSARGMSRTTFSTDPRRNRNFNGRRLRVNETTSNISNSEKNTTLQSLQGTLPTEFGIHMGCGRNVVQYSDSNASDAPSSDRTLSTNTTLTCARGRSGSSDSNNSLQIVQRQPSHQRSVSDSSVFRPTFHSQRQAVEI